MQSARATPLPSHRLPIVPERLESCVRRLDPADRAVLDLSLNRGIPDVAMAPVLRTDPLRIAWKRARAIERVASRLGINDPADLGAVRSALMDLPSRAWLPLELQPAKAPPVLTPPEPANVDIVVRGPGVQRHHVRDEARLPMVRRMTRGTMRTHVRRAAGALALGAAATALALRRR